MSNRLHPASRITRLALSLTTAFLVLAAACSSSDGDTPASGGCTEGDSKSCACTNGDTGAQVCSSGAWGQCTCNGGNGGNNGGQGGSNPGKGGSNPGQGGSNPGQGGSNPGQGGSNPGKSVGDICHDQGDCEPAGLICVVENSGDTQGICTANCGSWTDCTSDKIGKSFWVCCDLQNGTAACISDDICPEGSDI